MKYIASCSFGKDSIATILLALENNEPLDGVVFCEVMYSHEAGISGEIPEHIEWVRGTAIPKLADMGVPTEVIRGERDYLYFFKSAIRRRGKYVGKFAGFPLGGRCAISSDCKTGPIRKYIKSLDEDITVYIGIAADEPKRLERLKDNSVSLLAKYGYTEQMAYDFCKKYGLLSPLYETRTRGGCWFCPNAKIESFCRFRRHNPELWKEFEALSDIPNLCGYGFRYDGKTLPEIVALMDQHDEQIRNTLFPELYK